MVRFGGTLATTLLLSFKNGYGSSKLPEGSYCAVASAAAASVAAPSVVAVPSAAGAVAGVTKSPET